MIVGAEINELDTDVIKKRVLPRRSEETGPQSFL